MELLKVLEDKVVALVDTINKLKKDNECLAKENGELKSELAELKKNATEGSKKTTMLVDDLIKSIDTLVQEAQ